MSQSAPSVSGSVRTSFLIFALIAALFMASCGSSAPLAISLVSSAGQSLAAGQSTTIAATVTHDSTNKGVTWTLSPTSGAGALSGATTTSVTYTAPATIPSATTVTITATSVANATKSVTFTINLLPVSISLAPTSPQTLEQGMKVSPITATVSNDPANKGVTWSLAGAGALSGQTATTVVYTAPASVTAASTATVTATSVADATKTAPFTINLVPPPSAASNTPPAGTVGVAYNTVLVATGGVAPYSWSVTLGTLPAGLTLASSGAIAGTPTANGTSNFTVQVKDANNFTATAALSIKINPAPLVVTTTSLPNGIVNTPGYSATLTSTGGAAPITWSWVAQAGSTLPNGLGLAPTGTISGTPTAAGTFNVTVTATDSSAPALTASKNLSVTIIPQLVISTSSPLPNGITNTAYTGVTLASTGGSGAVVWTLTGGTTLPANLSLNASTGAITGTPTTAGTFNFTVQAADSGTPQQKVTKSFTITIIQQLVITTPAALPTGSVTTPYSVTMAASGGTGAVTWAQTGGTLPGGLTFTSAGVLAGTPTTANTFNFSITATDSGVPAQTATVAFTVTITPKLAINTTSLPSGIVGTAYSQPLQTNNGGIAPITWSVTAGALPPGLSLALGTGVISGTPTSATGSPFSFTVQAADSGTPKQTATQALSISIATAPLSVVTTGLPNGVVGQSYSNAQLQSAGGNPPVTWSISSGSLPAWATLTPSTGAITGTPNATGTTSFTVKATDSSTPVQTATKALSITVVAALSITTTQSQIPAGIVGQSYSAPVAATGGTTPYAWSWAAQAGSSLPLGLGIDPASGTISGTPGGSGGTFNVTVTVTDSTSPQQTTSANFSITITVATLTVTTTSGSLPSGTVNTAYPNNVNLSATGGIPPYTWLQTGGTLPPGLSLSSSGVISGTPTTATGSPFNFIVTVTDSATPAHTANANLSITVNAAAACGPALGGSEAFLNGQYAFLLKGFDNGMGTGETSPQPALVGGVITVDGAGHITAGTVDLNGNSTAGVQTNTLTSGSYRVTSDQRGCMVITTSAGTQNYRFSLGNIASGVASTGHVIGFDPTGPFTAGIMRKQSSGSFSTSQVTGNYAFGVSSPQNIANCTNINGTNVCGGNFGAVGVLNLSAGSVTGGEVDFNDKGQLDGSSLNSNWPTSPIGISGGGTYTVSSTNGRGTLSFTPAATGATAVNAVIYVVSPTDVLVLSSDPQTGVNNNNPFGGELLKQSGTLSGNPLSGVYIGYQSGLGNTAGTSRTTLLFLTASGSSITGNQWRNDGSSFQFKSIGTGITYSVTAAGRMTVAGGGGGGAGPIFYLVNPNQAFALGAGTSVDTGFFQSQTGTSASGTYAFGVTDPQELNVGDESGVATFTPATTSISGISDNNSSGSQKLGSPFGPQSYSIDSTGLVSTPSGCAILANSTTCQTLIYVISPKKAVVIDIGSTNNTNTRIEVADQ
jgi:hypothetical protein